MGRAACATSSPKRLRAASSSRLRPSRLIEHAGEERLGLGGAQRRRAGGADAGADAAALAVDAAANEHTAITIALRVPILANCCAAAGGRDQ